MSARRKRPARRTAADLEREAKRAAQKEAGALDGRFRTKVEKSKRTYSRKRRPPADDQ